MSRVEINTTGRRAVPNSDPQGPTIWGRANSVNVQKVLWCAEELGLGYRRIDAGMAFGRNTEPDYLAMNPNGRVPTLVDGDFAVEEDQLQTALKSLRRNGINIVAIHSHMTHEQPRNLFFHYWGRGPAKKLAVAIQDALLASGLSGVSTEAQK